MATLFRKVINWTFHKDHEGTRVIIVGSFAVAGMSIALFTAVLFVALVTDHLGVIDKAEPFFTWTEIASLIAALFAGGALTVFEMKSKSISFKLRGHARKQLKAKKAKSAKRIAGPAEEFLKGIQSELPTEPVSDADNGPVEYSDTDTGDFTLPQ